ncbi:hypothetical protein [Fibrobacter sp. UWB11]|uniref:hypothetical protein n=1 Tax=Fibrobacter sp. UWB11 TaxID=1896202 RepID=UPI00092A8C2E|nr:hypothetical protein [Fibrobacter sp. UWB11]SIO10393.1 hypothetical protein SAMN05720758_1430 [Fibrobacter sp. UWB11]
MNFFLLIAIPLLGYSLRNYHKAFLWYFLFRIFLSNFVPFLAIAGLPQIRMSLVCDAWFIFLPILRYLIKANGKIVIPRLLPIFKPFAWMIFLILFSSIVSFLPFFNSINSAVLECISSYIFPLLFFAEIKQSEDLKFIIKGLMVVSIIAAIYGAFEAFMFRFMNPLVLYEQSLNPNNIDPLWVYETLARGSRGRVSSIFAHAIGCGCTMAIFTVFFLYIKGAHEKYIASNKLYYAAVFSSILLVGLCNCRSPYPLLLISLLALWNFRPFLRLATSGIILLVVFHSELSSFIDVFLSIFDKNIEQQMGGGSNVEMRTEQFEALIRAWLSGNPIIGEGAYATRYWLERKIGLLGGESIWISLLLETGLLGCFFYLYIMKNLVTLGQGYGKRLIFFFVVGWIVMKTATSTPGLDDSLFFMIMFCIAKMDMKLFPEKCELKSFK